MSASLRADVCVVGGGPAGSAASWLLAREGVDVLLLDRARFPRDKPCGEYLSPEASRVLAAMGVLEEVERHASHLSGMKVRSPNGRWMHGSFAAAHGFRGFRDCGLAVRRILLDSILLRAAQSAGVRVVEGARAHSLLWEGRRVSGVAASASGRELRVPARAVIGADGLRSVVARRAGIVRRMRWPRRLALVAHYDRVADMTDAGEMHVDAAGYFGLAPVGDSVNAAIVVPAPRSRAAVGDLCGFMDNWIAARPHLRDRFAAARRTGTVQCTGPFAVRVRRAWVPGAAVVGDAADFYDPFTGEGIYAALRGAELLAPRILESLQQPSREAAALGDYDRARRREFGGKWLVERAVSVAVASPWIMDHLTGALGRRQDLADLLVGVCGDFVPPRELLRTRFLLPLIAGSPLRAPA